MATFLDRRTGMVRDLGPRSASSSGMADHLQTKHHRLKSGLVNLSPAEVSAKHKDIHERGEHLSYTTGTTHSHPYL